MDSIEKILSSPGFQQAKRTQLTCSRQKRVAQYKYGMIALTIEATEALVHFHAQKANQEVEVTWLYQTTRDPLSS